jgi:hypothetical protein
MKRVPLLILLFAMCLAVSPPAFATLHTLTSGNSTLAISTQTQQGAYDWIVDDVNVLYQQWFWYRIGNDREYSIDTLTQTGVVESVGFDGNKYGLGVRYANSAVQIEIFYTLVGGAQNSGSAHITEAIKITNLTPTVLDFHFFQYSDFDLEQSGNVDYVAIDPTKHVVNQTPASTLTGPLLSETVINQAASGWEANTFAQTRTKLNDDDADDLNGVMTAGPGDVTWAFQWDASIGGGSSFEISKTKRLESVPEPAAIGLMGSILLLIATKLRKRRA